MGATRLLFAFVGLYVAVGVVGCGGGGNGDDTTTGVAAKQIEPAAQARAESIVLQLSDFPEGWRASSPDSADQGGQEEFNRCIGLDNSGITITGEADSRKFAMGDSAEVDSQARVYASTQEAATASQRYVAALGDDATVEDCFRDVVEQAIKDQGQSDVGVEIRDVDLGELSFTPPPGIAEAKAWQIEVPFEITSGEFKGASESLFLELVVLRQADARAIVTTQDESSPFDSGLRDELVRAVASRMQASANSVDTTAK